VLSLELVTIVEADEVGVGSQAGYSGVAWRSSALECMWRQHVVRGESESSGFDAEPNSDAAQSQQEFVFRNEHGSACQPEWVSPFRSEQPMEHGYF
jgi:hypothetical protein